jgi:Protein of unknown function (DUF3365)
MWIRRWWLVPLQLVLFASSMAAAQAPIPQQERCRTENRGPHSALDRALDRSRQTRRAADAGFSRVRLEKDSRVEQGRQITQQFGAALKAALERAMAEQGPVGAILVCRDEAPRIAARLSDEHGVRVARTALKIRNPDNLAQDWQLRELAAFQRRLEQGAEATTLEFFEARPDGARYLKAIVTAPLCTACHGETLAPELQQTLQQHYPADQATGFKLGDLRGAFSVEWPGDSVPPH